jgi:hypothetical protein
MKLFSVLTTCGLGVILALGPISPTQARPALAPAPSFETRDECLQRCFDQYTANLAVCKDSAKVCTLWILFVCVASHTDLVLLASCNKKAEETYAACKAACVQA